MIDLDALAPMDVAGRAERLRPLVAEAGAEALVVSNLTNVRYLTGFTGSAALLVVTTDGLTFVSRHHPVRGQPAAGRAPHPIRAHHGAELFDAATKLCGGARRED